MRPSTPPSSVLKEEDNQRAIIVDCKVCGSYIPDSDVCNTRRLRYCPGCKPVTPKKAPPTAPDRPERPKCVHCKQRLQCRPRQLCWPCYHNPEIRASTDGSWSKSAYRSPVQSGHKIPEPTIFFPGTLEKVAVLEQRAEAGEILWHPQDARCEGPTDRRGAFLDHMRGKPAEEESDDE